MFDLPSWLLIFPVLGFLVFVHELGHFAMAKWFGIGVKEFGFGFPPRIYGLPFRGTLYSINWIPLGGFVRLVGEEDPNEPESFARQSAYKRAIVLAAGSFMNLLVPVVIITVLFMQPHDTLLGGTVVISSVAPGSPAQEAGLRAGDAILRVDGQLVTDTLVLVKLVRNKVGQPVELSIRREQIITGLASSPDSAVYEMVRVVPRKNSPRLKVVEEATDPDTQVSLVEAQRYDRNLEIGDTLTQGAIGVMIGLANPKFGKTSEPVWRAVPMSFRAIWNFLSLTWNGLVDGLSTGSNPGFAGPIGIAQVTGEVVDEFGFSWVFQLVAVLSISLAIINILPFPPLDGGRLMFVGIEFLRGGRRISPKREGLVHLVGVAMIIGLLLALSYFDVVRILNGESILR